VLPRLGKAIDTRVSRGVIPVETRRRGEDPGAEVKSLSVEGFRLMLLGRAGAESRLRPPA